MLHSNRKTHIFLFPFLNIFMAIILDDFVKFRKATITFIMSHWPSGRTSVCMEQLSSRCTDFHEI
jgi:hypothetical protein